MRREIVFFSFLLSLTLFNGCKKIPEGNLSSLVRYEALPIEIQQGRSGAYDALNTEGSSKPFTVRLLNVYDRETGEDVTSIFTKEYPIKLWTALYDPKVDTTLVLINAKRKDAMIAPISVDPVSGQLLSNPATEFLPLGQYKFDLEIENSAGKRIFPGIGEFDLIEAPFFEVPTLRATVAVKVGEENITRTIPSNRDHINVTRISNGEDRIVVRFLDKNGNVFNAKTEVQKRPNGGTAVGFLQSLQDFALSTTEFDDRLEFTYGLVPFPIESLGNRVNYNYRIPSQFIDFDPSLGLTYNTYSCNVRFSFRAFAPGTYNIDVIVPQVTRVR